MSPPPPSLGRRIACAGLLTLLAGCAATASSSLSPQDQSDIARIQSYLDGLRGLRARFVQVGADGGSSAGTVWYDPGRLRLQYDTPARMVVVAAGGHLVAHRDSDDSTTRIALSGNPLGLLLARPLRLSGPISVTDIQRGPGILQASLTRAANPAQGLLTLIFSDPSAGLGSIRLGSIRLGSIRLGLIGLEAVDARRQRTGFHLIDVQTGLALDPGLFTPPAG